LASPISCLGDPLMGKSSPVLISIIESIPTLKFPTHSEGVQT
jgi:hypothetical protein